MNLFLSNLLGTLKNTFRINKLTIDASGLTVPRTIVLPDKAGTIALLSDIGSTSTFQPINLSINTSSHGTTPRLLGSVKLAAGTYTAKANLGGYSFAYTAYLVLKKGGVTVATISRSGYMQWISSSQFTLSVAADLDIYIYGSSRTAYVYVKGVQIL